ncbi:MAG TPA: class I SAM-dependent methyltransferase [Chryseolinea sp.]
MNNFRRVLNTVESLERVLVQQGYSKNKGFYTRNTNEEHVQSEPDKVWSILAQNNPIQAAAATNDSDWYAKYPHVIDQEIPDEEILALDAGCGYGRVAIPLLKNRTKLKIIGVDASTVMLKTFWDLAETEGIEALDQRLVLLHSALSHLAFADETFNRIYSCAVLLHNPYQDVQDILTEFYRLLKPMGKVVLVGSFPNVMNLEGIQNFVYSKWFASPQANGPVRPYTRKSVQSLFLNWKEIHISPTGVTILPREIANIPMPLGPQIRRFNKWIDEKHFAMISQSSLFSKHFDVVAQK